MRISEFFRHRRDSGHPAWYLTTAGVLLIAAAAGLVAFAGFARYSFPVGPARVSAAVSPSLRPSTTMVVPPFGSIRARTHNVPTALRVSLDEVNLPALEQIAERGRPGPRVPGRPRRSAAARVLPSDSDRSRRGASGRSVRRLGAAARMAARGRLGGGGRTRARRTRGADRGGPRLERAQEADVSRGARLRAVAHRPRAAARPQRHVAAGAGGRARRRPEPVLPGAAELRAGRSTGGHVPRPPRDATCTSIPSASNWPARLAREFKVSLVIDTGDIDNYGSPIEAAVVRSQIPSSVPQLYVPGNHDSPAVVAALDGGAQRDRAGTTSASTSTASRCTESRTPPPTARRCEARPRRDGARRPSRAGRS